MIAPAMIRIPNATLKTYLNKKHKKIIDSAENNTKGGVSENINETLSESSKIL